MLVAYFSSVLLGAFDCIEYVSTLLLPLFSIASMRLFFRFCFFFFHNFPSSSIRGKEKKLQKKHIFFLISSYYYEHTIFSIGLCLFYSFHSLVDIFSTTSTYNDTPSKAVQSTRKHDKKSRTHKINNLCFEFVNAFCLESKTNKKKRKKIKLNSIRVVVVIRYIFVGVPPILFFLLGELFLLLFFFWLMYVICVGNIGR